MNLVAYHPGKLGDAILQLPVTKLLATTRAEKVDVWLDSGTCKPLVELLEAQSWVGEVALKGPSKHYSCGGQPWQGEFTTQEHMDREIVCMGFRTMPNRQITLETLQNVPFNLPATELLKEPLFETDNEGTSNTLILHANYRSSAGTPGFWIFLNDHWDELRAMFDMIAWVGTHDEVNRAFEVYPGTIAFHDEGSLKATATLISGARCVIGPGSSMVTLAGVQKIPAIRVHDPVGGLAKVIWSNLGDNQLNETERDLRTLWPEWKKRWVETEVAVG